MIVRFSPSIRTEIKDGDSFQVRHGTDITHLQGIQKTNRLFTSWVEFQVKGLEAIRLIVQRTYADNPEDQAPAIARLMIQKLEAKGYIGFRDDEVFDFTDLSAPVLKPL